MPDEMLDLVSAYAWPAQAYWRYFELMALRSIRMDPPVLEIGCGNGKFSSLIFDQIDEGIDVNPKAVERARAGGLYKVVRCGDARDLDGEANFGTVYANCVMEHIPNVSGVLGGCNRALRAGGQLVMTVPLEEMNRHLLLRSSIYARWRQRQLSHCNLLGCFGWRDLLQKAGFRGVEFTPYLGASACSFWDAVDVIGCFGYGRFSMATAISRLSQTIIPQHWRTRLLRPIASWLMSKVAENSDLSAACAAVIVARK